ncbi:MYND finger containing protein [Novymonas esmeraldas]|uniref:MYND finger containing protein n=1 Tax=Novymonas esmeraldas TaxID=1808958 RepID=A0AAW0F6H6_9TRYP
MSIFSPSSSPGVVHDLPHVGGVPRAGRSTTPGSGRGSPAGGQRGGSVVVPRPSSTVRHTSQRLSSYPGARRPSSAPRTGTGTGTGGSGHRSPSYFPQASPVSRSPHRSSSSRRSPRRGGGGNERSGDYTSLNWGDAAPRSPSRREPQHGRLASAAAAAAAPTTSPHLHGTYGRGSGGSSTLGRSGSGTAPGTMAPSAAATAGSSSGRARAHLLLQPAALSTSVSGTFAMSGAAPLDGGPLGRLPSPPRASAGESVTASMFSPATPSRGGGAASVLLNAGASAFLTAATGASGGSGSAPAGVGGVTLSSAATGNTFGAAVGVAHQHLCTHCKVAEEVLYRCPCGLARYCSTTCQRAHWPVHKAVCKHVVRAVHPPTKRCDWCHTSSQTLRQCGCGFAYYCDTQCQRADWVYHCIVCSTVNRETLATALVGGRPLRTRREAATQTAHWQISVPVIQPAGPGDGAAGTSFSMHHNSPNRRFRSDSDDADDDDDDDRSAFSDSTVSSSSAAVVDASTPPRVSLSQQRSQRRAASEYGSQANGESGSAASVTLHHSRESPACTSGYADPTVRTHVSMHHRPSGGAPSRSVRSHHHATSSLYNSLHVSSSAVMSHPHYQAPDSVCETGALSARLLHGASSSPIAGASASRHHSHHHFMSASTDHHEHPSYGHDGDAVGGDRVHGSAVAGCTAREQPGVVAFLLAARHIIEREETKSRAALFRKFQLGCAELHMRVLGKREEEARMEVLKEEVLWCVLTGNPAWKRLRQALSLHLKSQR